MRKNLTKVSTFISTDSPGDTSTKQQRHGDHRESFNSNHEEHEEHEGLYLLLDILTSLFSFLSSCRSCLPRRSEGSYRG